MPSVPEALDPTTGYSDEDPPLALRLLLSTVFGVTFSSALMVAYRRRGELPESFSPFDVLLVGVATHKLSRLITKDKVTAFARAPFTRYVEPAGRGELEEEPRGSGLRRVLGELLVCPYCISQWIVGGFAVGMVAAPRLTRLAAFMFSAKAAADFLQLAYLAAGDEVSG